MCLSCTDVVQGRVNTAHVVLPVDAEDGQRRLLRRKDPMNARVWYMLPCARILEACSR